MKVILKKNIPHLGYKNQVITVKPGYARNYLIPQELVATANKMNLKIAEENKKQSQHKLEKQKEEAQQLIAQLKNVTIQIPVKISKQGKLFKQLAVREILSVLEKFDIKIASEKVILKTKVKTLGNYQALLKLHPEIEYPLLFQVIEDKKEIKT